ncbi:hypothetical protein B0O99DRAFT_745110 [Bisporella sp. PMI_857]|nr:hypothetical protein B0O99DRAFT_745110 [Bisporella sp. PMI_857]
MEGIWTRNAIPKKETKAGTIASVILSLIAMSALSICISQRVRDVRKWNRLPLLCWLILLIYLDSIIFVFSTAILSQGYGVDSSKEMCSRAVILCLGCYMTTKLIYYFLVERAYIIRRTSKPRMKSKLYLFNSFGMLIPYCVVIVLNFYFRFAIYGEDRSCRIGMKKAAMIPLIAFDILVNIYLTTLFILPLRNLYSYKNNPSSQTRSIALRTFIGSCATLTSSVVNLTVVMVLEGEPGWICLMCCNLDILFSALVLHWLTSKDNASTLSSMDHPHVPLSPLSPLSSRRPNRLVPRSPVDGYEMGKLIEVRTLVSAGKDGIEEELRCPPNAITVSREMVRAVDELRMAKERESNYINREGSKEEFLREKY